ncbi:MAG: virulence factor [Gammaproteobacteria bacterium]|nr:virulence factor [Gammaproteobacteria bacterium]
MARLTIVYWRDIPAQVIGKAGRRTVKKQLSERFQVAIDRAAMRAGRGSSDLYLSEWRRETRELPGTDLAAEVERTAGEFESTMSDADLLRLIRSKGNNEEPAAAQ